MNGRGKSDSPVVPRKPPNEAGRPAEETVEGRGLAKGNLPERNAFRTQSREGAPSALERVRQAATKDRKQRFTALLHHVYDVERLRGAYRALRPGAAAGVDGVTWHEYGTALEDHLRDLSERVRRGAYRAKPVRRAYIEKTDGQWTQSEVGTVQGGSISPLLANIYLHYVFDLWVQRWRKKQAHGDVITVRYADDFVVGFQHRDEAESFLNELRERFASFGLALHPEKTRLIEFGRFADQHRKGRGDGKPETFNFLGFTHICGKTSTGRFGLRRQTMRKRWQAKLRELYDELRRRRHRPIQEQGAYVRAVVQGHVNYYGVPGNRPALGAFRAAAARLWHKALQRRSQRSRLNWARMKRLLEQWLPPIRICHPHPSVRFGART